MCWEELDCSYHSGISQNGISELKCLKVLRCCDNEKICDVNYLSGTLEELECERNCGINQAGISHLKKIKKFICSYNKKINNLDHLIYTLEKLECYQSNINQNE